MWKPRADEHTPLQALGYSALRVVAITIAGLRESRIFSRAAALSFSSLLGLGPLVALTVLVSGFVLQKTQPDLAQGLIEDVIEFIAPQVALGQDVGDPAATEGHAELSGLIRQFIDASQSGAVGLAGSIVLILIVIQLFTVIEDAFNELWGVKRGRNIVTRVIMYWTTITLGAVVAFAGVAIFVAETLKLTRRISAMADWLPTAGLGEWIALHGAQIAGYGVIYLILGLFYRFIPNTQVNWSAAFAGALFTVSGFALNNMLAFLYVERVALQRTLYQSLGVLPVLMIGLYFFWLFLLVGGRVAFAVQNAHFKSGKIAWDELSIAAQESLCLLLFVRVCRQFRDCLPPRSSSQLAEEFKLPAQLVAAAMAHLLSIGLVSRLPAENEGPFDSSRFQPAKPLEKIRLLDFKRSFESLGESVAEIHQLEQDPAARRYRELLRQSRESAFGELSIESLLAENS